MSDPILEPVLSDIYQAVHDPGRWRDVVISFCAAVDADRGALHSPPMDGAIPAIFAMHNLDPTPVLDRIHIYGRQAPFAERAIRLGVAPGVFINSEVYPPDELHESEYYREYMVPTNSEFGLQLLLRSPEAAQPSTAGLIVGRGPAAEDFSAREKSTGKAIFPHLRRCIDLVLNIAPAQAVDPAIQDAFDYFSTACLLFGEGGGLLLANRRARVLFDENDGLNFEQGELRSTDNSANLAVANMLAQLTARRTFWQTRAAQEIVIRRPSGRPPLIAVGVPLGNDNPFGAVINAPRTALYILDGAGATHGAAQLKRLASLFALTDAEAEVADGLIRGLSVQQVAEGRGSTVLTVRSQVKAILEKTQSNRQSDLFRLQGLLGAN
ncbi:MAG: hypothetical protein CFE28_10695 [Alphaproteobacteria bacterium PA2]|nr:MAG: hypothetical protein CFE28_10695 [Alphaproteobacteria bacterium PA2]